ncbi:MAG TPA: class I SAM-dependent methyltransferase [Candidatus Paceibacterota bacterium]
MKRALKKLIPNQVFNIYRIIRIKRTEKSKRQIFTEYFVNNYWNSSESKSGRGSTIEQTKTLIQELEILLVDLGIESILDIPCGDYNWMQKVKKANIKYIGADIVKPLIKANKEKFKEQENVEFKTIDIINDPLPKCDLIFVRDCFVHLSFQEISKSIQNIKKSGSKYLLTTTFPNHKENVNSSNGGWRTINLVEEPFNLSTPLLVINENCTEDNLKYLDKSIALWELSEL